MLTALCEQLGWTHAAQQKAAQAQTCVSLLRTQAIGRSSGRNRLKYTSLPKIRAAAGVNHTLAHRDGAGPHRAADQAATPLLDAVVTVAGRVHEVPLHIPGHKRGNGAHPRLRQDFGEDVFHHDLTELPGAKLAASMSRLISGSCCAPPHTHALDHIRSMYHVLKGATGLDYLSSPTGAIAEAQRLAADAFGADRTWFVVNGTTAGIQAAVLSACGPGDTLIAARNCHLSAVSAMALAGAPADSLFGRMCCLCCQPPSVLERVCRLGPIDLELERRLQARVGTAPRAARVGHRRGCDACSARDGLCTCRGRWHTR